MLASTGVNASKGEVARIEAKVGDEQDGQNVGGQVVQGQQVKVIRVGAWEDVYWYQC